MLGGPVTATRRRAIDASPATVWALVRDPHHQPRWWPGVERVEGVAERRFTQVLRTRRGRPVRVDYDVSELEEEHLVVWRQALAGSPFARVLSDASVRIELAAEHAGTVVTIAHAQTLRGSNRTGAPMLRRATGRRLEEALEGLERIAV